MNEVMMLRSAEPRKILEAVIEKRTPAIMSYLSRGKWHVAKLILTGLGANRLNTEISPRKEPQPINVQVGQSVGISIKYGYGKFIFETPIKCRITIITVHIVELVSHGLYPIRRRGAGAFPNGFLSFITKILV